MKIAVFFTYDYSVNSLRSAGLLERELKIYEELQNKFNLEFTFFTFDDKDYSMDYKNFKFVSVYKFISKSNNKFLRLLKSLAIPIKLAKKTKNIDILHQHQLLGSWIPLTLSIIQRKPLLIRTGYDAYLFSQLNSESLFKRLFYKLLTKYTLKFCNLYTVTSNSDLDFLKKSFTFNYQKIKVVPNWIERNDNFSNERFKNKILMVGRLEKQKNYEMVYDFLKESKLDFEIDIYGSGSLYDELNDSKISKDLKINFLGNKKYFELQKEYKKYKYFLSTSNFEGNPKTILEAQNNGCIVLASNIKNHTELIKHNENGFIFNNIKEIEYYLNHCLQNEEIGKLFFKNNQLRLKNNQIENISRIMFDDYKDLVEFK